MLKKPDLVMHPHLARLLPKNHPHRVRLEQKFRVFAPNELPITAEAIRPAFIAVAADGSSRLRRLAEVILSPYFKPPPEEKGDGGDGWGNVTDDPSRTSYYLSGDTPLYRIGTRRPRYVIWLTGWHLTVCGTRVDRIPGWDQFPAAVNRALEWAEPSVRERSVIVFDLDETLVDDRGCPLAGADRTLAFARDVFDLVVLYSHGTRLHVDECRQRLRFAFDVILVHDPKLTAPGCKNLLALYNHVPRQVRFTVAILVDDSLYNWTPEYTGLVIPARGLKTLWPVAQSAIDVAVRDSTHTTTAITTAADQMKALGSGC